MALLNVAVFASGGGSNFEAIAEMADKETVNYAVRLVISNKANAFALERARKRNIHAYHLDPDTFEQSEDYEKALLSILRKHHTNFIVLAGYLKLIPSYLVRAFRHRIINIHPALLPAFGGKGMYGMRVHQAVLDYGCKVSGATVHIVTEEYDTGPPVLQRCVAVRDDDTPERLAKRVLEVEHQIYPEALRLFADGRVKVEGREVKIINK